MSTIKGIKSGNDMTFTIPVGTHITQGQLEDLRSQMISVCSTADVDGNPIRIKIGNDLWRNADGSMCQNQCDNDKLREN
jgi:hypothetical protein